MGERGRNTLRLSGYDYSGSGFYYITLCTHERRRIFGEVLDGVIHLSLLGTVVQEQWLRTAILRPEITLDSSIVMPNHMHGVLQISATPMSHDPVGAHRDAPLHRPRRSLGAIVAGFKGSVTRMARRPYGDGFNVRQRNNYERVVRSQAELHELRRYIHEKPVKWENDRYL